MNFRLGPLLVCALAAGLALGGAAEARADAFSSVFQDYQKSGTISPCSHSIAELKSAQRTTPPDIGQYAPDFPGRLSNALKARERGACSGGAGTAGAPAPASPALGPSQPRAVPPATQPAVAPTPLAAPPISGEAIAPTWTPLEPIVLAIVAVVAAIAFATAVLSRIFGWTLERLVPARHQVAEAGYRASAVWGDFRDWVRLGALAHRGPRRGDADGPCSARSYAKTPSVTPPATSSRTPQGAGRG